MVRNNGKELSTRAFFLVRKSFLFSGSTDSTCRNTFTQLVKWSRYQLNQPEELLSCLTLKVENRTHATFDLHSLRIFLLWVFKEDVGEMHSWYQALDVVGQMHHHALSQQDCHCPLGQEDTLWDGQQNQEETRKRGIRVRFGLELKGRRTKSINLNCNFDLKDFEIPLRPDQPEDHGI